MLNRKFYSILSSQNYEWWDRNLMLIFLHIFLLKFYLFSIFLLVNFLVLFGVSLNITLCIWFLLLNEYIFLVSMVNGFIYKIFFSSETEKKNIIVTNCILFTFLRYLCVYVIIILFFILLKYYLFFFPFFFENEFLFLL